ncbi:MAG: Fic family protein [Desulfobacteraceae bacterium]
MDKHWQIKPDRDKALMLAMKMLPEFVHDAVLLEGINYTLPEIQTLLQGITVGGRKLTDQKIAINQAETWRYLFSLVRVDKFQVSKTVACSLQEIAAEGEALDSGAFRSGSVTISGTKYQPPGPDKLHQLFDVMTDQIKTFEDIYDQAVHIFLTMARTQFFFDVNKRMGRFMMNGHLLQAGYPAINVPATRELEFNQLMVEYYGSGESEAMNIFLRSCLDERHIKIMKE